MSAAESGSQFVMGRSPRQRWLSILARAREDELQDAIKRTGGVPEHIVLKAADAGTIMLEGRAGGTGQRFNLGEATVTRCVIRLRTGTIGVSYALGIGRRKARLAALIDARLQDANADDELHRAINSMAAAQSEARDLASRKAAATKVAFFTMARGDG